MLKYLIAQFRKAAFGNQSAFSHSESTPPDLLSNYFATLERIFSDKITSQILINLDDRLTIKQILSEHPPISSKEWENFLWFKLQDRIRAENLGIPLPKLEKPFQGIQEELEKGTNRPLKPFPKEFSPCLVKDLSKVLAFFSNGLLVQEYYQDIEKIYDSTLLQASLLNPTLEGRLLVFKSLATELLSSQQLNQLSLSGISRKETRIMLTLHGDLDEWLYKNISLGTFNACDDLDIFIGNSLGKAVNIAFDPIAQSNTATNNGVVHGALPHVISFMAVSLALQDEVMKLNHSLDIIVKSSLEIEWQADVKGIHHSGSTVQGFISSVWSHWDSTGGLYGARISRWPQGISLNCADDVTTEISNREKYPSIGKLQEDLAIYLSSDERRTKIGEHLRALIPNTVSYEFVPPLAKLIKMNIFEARFWQRGSHLYEKINLDSAKS